MSDFAKEIVPVPVEKELKKSYLDYAMSVIIGRALPDVRDGLKPVHRRVLYSMHELGNEWNKPYKKSARIVGDVIGKYHPHGDTPVYDAIVRMAQPFSLRYVLIDGQGNFGSVDGDMPAAMRYTEVRMSKIAQLLLDDLDKETVDFVPNYDENESMPTVLPARIPHLLINGTSGIAVGMATQIPPHNLTEVINACLTLLDNPDASLDDILKHIQGPDFPTKGIIYGKSGIYEAYRTGRGRIVVRARTFIETDKRTSRENIIIAELPYQVNKARLIEKIAELIKEKKIDGITGLRDESDKDGMRVVIEIRRGENAEVILNNLFDQTSMQSAFNVNMVALIDNCPKLLTLLEVLHAFLQFRREIVTRRTLFELRKSRDKAHILEGLGVALGNIDAIIDLIKKAPTPAIAKEALLEETWPADIVMQMLGNNSEAKTLSRPDYLSLDYGLQQGAQHRYKLSPEQAQAILDLRLHRLTNLEQTHIFNDYKNVLENIKYLIEILRNPDKLLQVIRDELMNIRDTFGDTRQTALQETEVDFNAEDFITDHSMVVTVSYDGYAKTQLLEQYRAQRRGGKGKIAAQVKEDDFVEHLQVANNRDTLLCFSNRGKVYWLKVYKLPQASRQSKGRPLVNLLSLQENEKINAMLAVKDYSLDKAIIMATEKGIVKKTRLSHFSRPRPSGIVAVSLDADDKLIDAKIVHDKQDILLFNNSGKVIRFSEEKIRSLGRGARGIRGMRLSEGQKIISLLTAHPQGQVLIATEKGYGKRTLIEKYRQTARGGKGITFIRLAEKNGDAMGAIEITPEDEVMLISNKGTLVRIRVREVSLLSRTAQGVRLMQMATGEKLSAIVRIPQDSLA